MTRRMRRDVSGWLMIMPQMAGILIFSLIPIGMAILLSFTDILYVQSNSFSGMGWVGFGHFSSILSDSLFWKAVLNTFIAALCVPIQMAFGLLIAVLLGRLGKRLKRVFRAVLFIPYVSSMVATVFMWQYIFEPNGFINSIISATGGEKIAFLTQSEWFLPCIILMMCWSGMGYYIILYEAALTNVNQSCLEAAELDGAGRFRRFFSIVLPAISPTTFYLLVMGIINGLQVFTWFQIICANLGDGFLWGPENTGITIVYYIYQMAYVNQFGMGGVGRACAMSVLLVMIIGALTAINFLFQKKWVHYD